MFQLASNSSMFKLHSLAVLEPQNLNLVRSLIAG